MNDFIIWTQWWGIFEVIHQRGRVGKENGIKFIIHTAENGHNEPHLHAKYQNKEVSISINTCKVITGNLPINKLNEAIEWTKNNQAMVKDKWNELINGITIPV